jgi:hypothetical protein
MEIEIDVLINDAKVRLAKAQERLQEGSWRHGVFELGCASARIIQVVELLAKDIRPH